MTTTAMNTTQLADRLRRAGLRATGPRLAILHILVKDPSHPTAEDVHEALRVDHPSLSLSTVYKTLEAFLRAGLCRRVVGDGSRLRVDGLMEPHDHALCRGCGRIFDIRRAIYPLPPPPSSLPNGLYVTGVHVEYDVVCAECRSKGLSTESQDNHSVTRGGD